MTGARDLTVVAVTPDRFDDLAGLFESNGATRGCWCMAFILSRSEYHAGRRGGNRDEFERRFASGDPPAGLLGLRDGTPVAWCAVGPRSRYESAIGPRATIMKGRDPAEDGDVWFVPCFFTRVGHRRTGTTRALLGEAIELARRHGAKAIEGFPLADDAKAADGYLGREHVFAACGFTCIARPTPRRAVMRLDLPPGRGDAFKDAWMQIDGGFPPLLVED